MRRYDADVVVTGLGAITPLGGDVAATWLAMLAGTSGVRSLEADWATDLPTRIAAPAAAEPGDRLEPDTARRMDRCQQLALVAAREAWQDAGAPTVDPQRLGVSVASGVGGVITALDAFKTLNEKGWRRVHPFTVPMLMANSAAGWISIEFGARAGAHTTVSACSSGAEAIGYGVDMIRSGRADVVLAGGSEAPIHPLNIAAFAAMRALSTRNDAPERASRPFDKGRDGFVLGEGAGIIVIESSDHAAARGAHVHAVAAGVGYSADAHHIAQPDPLGVGAVEAIERALADAQTAPEQVVHVNAHATATPVGDALETRAIKRALGTAAERVVVSSTKSMTGHLLGGAGAVESVVAIRALGERVAPPTINLDDLDNEVAETGLIIAREPRELAAVGHGVGDRPLSVLNNSFGFGGHNVALLFTSCAR